MGELVVAQLSHAEARSLTDEVKRDAEALWAKLLELYEGGAHTALKYSSWGDYFEAEFGGSDATAYRLLQSARVMRELPMGSRPATERQARELAPLLDEPELLREAWEEAIQDGEVTAKKVHKVVQERKGESVESVMGSTDFGSQEAQESVRTQVLLWFEQGARVANLLQEGKMLGAQSTEDKKSLRHDLDVMAALAKELKGVLR